MPVDEVSELEDDCLVDDSSASDLASEVLDEEVDEDCDAEDDDEDEEDEDDEDESLSESALAGPAPWLIVTMTPTPRATANVPTRPTKDAGPPVADHDSRGAPSAAERVNEG